MAYKKSNPNGQSTMANSEPVVLSSDHSDIKITLDSEAVVLGAGSAAIGKLSANSGVDIGDVDVTSLPSTVHSSDFDTGAGTDTTLSFGIAVPASGGAAVIGGDATNGLDVDVTRVSGTVTVDGSGVTQPVSASSLPLPTGASTSAKQDTIIGHVDGIEALLTTIDADTSNLSVVGGGTEATAIRVTIASDSTGVVSVDDNGGTISVDDGGGTITVDGTVASTQSGTWNVGTVTTVTGTTSLTPGTGATNLGKAEDAAHSTGDVGVMSLGVRAASPTERSAGPTDGDYEPFATNEVGAVWISPTPSANGGLSIFRSLDLDESEEDVKTSAGTVYSVWVTNTATSTRFLKFYNATAANVTVGTTTPVITIGIPGNSSDDISGNFSSGGIGIQFSTAISVAATTGVADNDTGAPGANEVIVNIFYK